MNGTNDGRAAPPSHSAGDSAAPGEGELDAEEPRAPRRPPIHVLEDNTLHTRLTRELGVHYPFVSAGMAFVALPPLVIAVSEAGGIGMLGSAPEPAPFLRARLHAIREGTQRPFGVNFIVEQARAGDFTTREHIDTCIAEKVPVVAFHWGLPPSDWVRDLKAAGTKVWVQASSVEFARDALALGVDGLIAQGRQAAGHNRGTLPTLQLVRELRGLTDTLPILAAGGIADGLSAARALYHGADGVWVGTRMVASVEAYAHPGYKQRVVDGDARDSDFTTLFGPEWTGARQRVLRNRVVREWAGREARAPSNPSDSIGTTRLYPGLTGGDALYALPRFSAFVPTPDTKGDLEEMALPASGSSMARIESVLPAGQIVVEMMEGAHRLLANPYELETDTDENDRS
ncbi:2-nitropropane dioxygenase [Myxococcus stipitatus DSM 14675]|uniref:2-nitropropane dioxygenase n=1 Tax=Myxococcus stipitatus (strain DSM 14675 / JCM 12634 / Mx s8) TaxID=1278073 RepID=L7U5V2_MYXSD|nr:nitronate monooxygenase [Myxococcus stipitatus]AGC41854.1 2-nitropropane dioxygenase [Myxococcus stipitatus DSM 14675]